MRPRNVIRKWAVGLSGLVAGLVLSGCPGLLGGGSAGGGCGLRAQAVRVDSLFLEGIRWQLAERPQEALSAY